MSDTPSVFSNIIHKARKEYTCCECNKKIEKGERYYLFKGCWDGRWEGFKTCLECEELRNEFASEYNYDEQPAFGELHEWVREANR